MRSISAGRPTSRGCRTARFFVADGYANSRVVKFDKNGKYLTSWGTKGIGPGQFNLPARHRHRSQSPGLRGRRTQQPHSGIRRERQVPRPVAEHLAPGLHHGVGRSAPVDCQRGDRHDAEVRPERQADGGVGQGRNHRRFLPGRFTGSASTRSGTSTRRKPPAAGPRSSRRSPGPTPPSWSACSSRSHPCTPGRLVRKGRFRRT